MTSSALVVKVGGSLFDLPDLGERLDRWLETLSTAEVVLVPGGGAAADVVRDLDRCHRLGEERSHWLALRALTLNAHFLAAVVPAAVVIQDLADAPAMWRELRRPILDLLPFALADERRPDHLPHSWSVTSDSLAARVAVVVGARQLILLKSVSFPARPDWHEAAKRGRVDAHFARLTDACAELLEIRAVNLREWQP